MVAQNGIKLDGSHRASIAVYLHKKTIPVAIVQIFPEDAEWMVKMQEIINHKLLSLLPKGQS